MAIPSKVAVSIAAFAANDAIRICREDIGLRPGRRSRRAGRDRRRRVRGGVGGSGGVGEEDSALGAKGFGAFFASNAACGGVAKWGGGEDTELGAGTEEEWSGVPTIGNGDGVRCGEVGRESVGDGVGKAAAVGHGGDRGKRGGESGGGEGQCSSSLLTPLSNSTSHRLFAAFLVRFVGGGEGAGGDTGGDG